MKIYLQIVIASVQLLQASRAPALPQHSELNVIVGPNVLVSHNIHEPHWETAIAARFNMHFDSETHLLGASTAMTDDDRRVCEIYSSLDGGSTWSLSNTSQSGPLDCRGDPQVAIDAQGDFYFVGMGQEFDNFTRSEDQGRSWSRITKVLAGDHPQLLIDTSAGRFAGRIYIGMNFGGKTGVYRSDDHGNTFTGPVPAAMWEEGFDNSNVQTLGLFSDGSIFVPFLEWSDKPEHREAATNKYGVAFVISEDGGVSFSKPARITDQIVPGLKRLSSSLLAGDFTEFYTPPVFRIGTGKFQDWVFTTWADLRLGKQRLFFSASRDRGLHWSVPKQIDSEVPTKSAQFQPAMAIAGNGTIGIQWYDTRDSNVGDSFDVYFAASDDAGQTFSRPAKVSSQASLPIRPGNIRFFYPLTDESVLGSWPTGGDYMGLAADDKPVFYPFWADSRSGTYQLYATKIYVDSKPIFDPQRETVEASIDSLVDLRYDSSRWDSTKHEAVFAIRIENRSAKTIYPPILLSIKRTTCESKSEIKTNGRDGNTLDYSKAVGGLGRLPPGGITEPLEWRLHSDGAIPTDIASCSRNNVSVTGHLDY
jgi:hypothetical protein